MPVLNVWDEETQTYVGIPTIKGEPGQTPVKGTDYWTAADRQSMVNDVVAALPKYNGEVVSV